MDSVEQKPKDLGLGIFLGSEQEVEVAQLITADNEEQTIQPVNEEDAVSEDAQLGGEQSDSQEDNARSMSAFSDSSSDEEEAPVRENAEEPAEDNKSAISSEHGDISTRRLPLAFNNYTFEGFDGNHADPNENEDSEPTTPGPKPSPGKPAFSPRTKQRITAEEERGYRYRYRPRDAPSLNRLLQHSGRDWDGEGAAMYKRGTLGRGRKGDEISEERWMNSHLAGSNLPRLPSHLNPRREGLDQRFEAMKAEDQAEARRLREEKEKEAETSASNHSVSPLSTEDEPRPTVASESEESARQEPSPMAEASDRPRRDSTPAWLTYDGLTWQNCLGLTDAEVAEDDERFPEPPTSAPPRVIPDILSWQDALDLSSSANAYKLSWEDAVELDKEFDWAEDGDNQEWLEQVRRASESSNSRRPSVEGIRSPPPARPENGMATAMALLNPDPQAQEFPAETSQDNTISEEPSRHEMNEHETTQDLVSPAPHASLEESASPGAEVASATQRAPHSAEPSQPNEMAKKRKSSAHQTAQDETALAERFRTENQHLRSQLHGLKGQLKSIERGYGAHIHHQAEEYEALHEEYESIVGQLKHKTTLVNDMEKMLRCDNCPLWRKTSDDIEDAPTKAEPEDDEDGAAKDKENCEGRCARLAEQLLEAREIVEILEKKRRELEDSLRVADEELSALRMQLHSSDTAREQEIQREEDQILADAESSECSQLSEENSRLRTQIADLELRIADFEAQNTKHQEDMQAHVDQYDARGQAQAMRIEEAEGRIRQLETLLEQARLAPDTASQSNDSFQTAPSAQSSSTNPLPNTHASPVPVPASLAGYLNALGPRPAGWRERDARWLNSSTAQQMRAAFRAQREPLEQKRAEEAELRRQVYQALVRREGNPNPVVPEMDAEERRAKLNALNVMR